LCTADWSGLDLCAAHADALWRVCSVRIGEPARISHPVGIRRRAHWSGLNELSEHTRSGADVLTRVRIRGWRV
jgi:hypothetical protein